jgi:NodT family efflux transporter outer membrane factor (OMF) lipoprotein
MTVLYSHIPGTSRKIMKCFASKAKGAMAASSVAALLLASACVPVVAAGPSMLQATGLETQRTFAAPEGKWPSDRWWEAYNDPQLTALIEEGLAKSPTLEMADARVRAAQAQAQAAGAANLPSVMGDATAGYTRQSLNEGFPDEFKPLLPHGWNDEGSAALNLQYQLDFFGRNRAALAAATSEADAAAADQAAARLQISTGIAVAYADLRRLIADRAALTNIVELRTNSANLVHQRFEAGLENQGQAAQADSEVAAARADLAAIDGQIARARNEIAALMGEGPDRGLEIADPTSPQLEPLTLPPTLAADLLGRRPDIVAARARVEAAAQRINVARADFYPNINLSALVGVQALGLNLLTQGDSRYGTIGPAISLPIFEGGRLEGRYRGAHAEYDEAVASYNQTLVNAMRDVANALADRHSLDDQIAAAHAALTAAEQSYSVARQRYDAGLSTYIDVLTVENGLVAQRRNVADLEAQAFSVDVELARALGGGFGGATA